MGLLPKKKNLQTLCLQVPDSLGSGGRIPFASLWTSSPATYIIPEFAVAIYYGLQILAATLVYCFYRPVLLTGPQKIIEIANSGMVFQEYDDIDNTTSVNQMSWGETFWMYIWMLVMLFMGPMM
jgi:hypothetical protein